jgi:hypothetical protein
LDDSEEDGGSLPELSELTGYIEKYTKEEIKI